MLIQTPYRIYPCGDHAVTIELGNTLDADINQKVISLFSYLQLNPVLGVKDIIPSYHTLTIIYDLALLKKQSPASSVYDRMCNQLETAANACTVISTTVRTIQIPVCYDLSMAPDLASIADLHQLSIEQVIQLHTEKLYRVYLLGFLPGFAYMGNVDEKIATPRKTTPRTMVPAGSVGIAGEQTGIYPFDSPGGWQLIGQTPVEMFNVEKPQPCYLQPGDAVQFYPITVTEFVKLKKA